MDKDEVLNPIKVLQTRLKEIAKSLNLDVESFVYRPSDENHPDIFQVQLVIRAEAVMSDAEKEQRKVDDEFKLLEAEWAAEHNANNRMPAIEQDLEDWFGKDEDE
jgi:hypothetical protein